MNAATVLPDPARPGTRGGVLLRSPRARFLVLSLVLLIVVLVALASLSPRWVAATGIALAIFLALKLATLVDYEMRSVQWTRLVGYLALWPGMNARTFLGVAPPSVPLPTRTELAAAVFKLGFGIALVVWATAHASGALPVLMVGWVGMIGVIFTFHFGLFHLLSWGWRRIGVDAPRLMRAPVLARSLAEFWGERWNTAFAELARRFVLRPLARRVGTSTAGLAVFAVSGVVHEIAISLPAGGGWGGPTLYFLLQAAGLAAEKTTAGRRLGLGAGSRGWLWTLLFTGLPLPLLFHAPMVERVVLPLFRFLEAP